MREREKKRGRESAATRRARAREPLLFLSFPRPHSLSLHPLTAVQEGVPDQHVPLAQALAGPPQRPEEEGGHAQGDDRQDGRPDGHHHFKSPRQRAHPGGGEGGPTRASPVGTDHRADQDAQVGAQEGARVEAGEGKQLQRGLRGARVEQGDQPKGVAPAPLLDGGGEAGGPGERGRGRRRALVPFLRVGGQGAAGRGLGFAPGGGDDRARPQIHARAQGDRRGGQGLGGGVVMPERPALDQAFRGGEGDAHVEGVRPAQGLEGRGRPGDVEIAEQGEQLDVRGRQLHFGHGPGPRVRAAPGAGEDGGQEGEEDGGGGGDHGLARADAGAGPEKGGGRGKQRERKK